MFARRLALVCAVLASAAGEDMDEKREEGDDLDLWGDLEKEVKTTDRPFEDPEMTELIAKVKRDAAAKERREEDPEMQRMMADLKKKGGGGPPGAADDEDPEMAKMMADLKAKQAERPGDEDDDAPAAPAGPLPPLDKCDACFVVWDSLSEVLRLEDKFFPDQESVLSGGRLDGSGKRVGTTIDYKSSELRTTRILGRVCEHVAAYRYNEREGIWWRNKTLAGWFEEGRKLPTQGNPGPGRAWELQEHGLKLLGYCGEVLEEKEDALAKAIIEDGVDNAGRAKFCGDVVDDCWGENLEDYMKRRGMAGLLSTMNDPDRPQPKPAKKTKKRRKKKKGAKADL